MADRSSPTALSPKRTRNQHTDMTTDCQFVLPMPCSAGGRGKDKGVLDQHGLLPMGGRSQTDQGSGLLNRTSGLLDKRSRLTPLVPALGGLSGAHLDERLDDLLQRVLAGQGKTEDVAELSASNQDRGARDKARDNRVGKEVGNEAQAQGPEEQLQQAHQQCSLQGECSARVGTSNLLQSSAPSREPCMCRSTGMHLDCVAVVLLLVPMVDCKAATPGPWLVQVGRRRRPPAVLVRPAPLRAAASRGHSSFINIPVSS